MKNEGFPSREEFYDTIMKLKKQREEKREGIYLGYLKEQKAKKKSRKNKKTTKDKPKGSMKRTID